MILKVDFTPCRHSLQDTIGQIHKAVCLLLQFGLLCELFLTMRPEYHMAADYIYYAS